MHPDSKSGRPKSNLRCISIPRFSKPASSVPPMRTAAKLSKPWWCCGPSGAGGSMSKRSSTGAERTWRRINALESSNSPRPCPSQAPARSCGASCRTAKPPPLTTEDSDEGAAQQAPRRSRNFGARRAPGTHPRSERGSYRGARLRRQLSRLHAKKSIAIRACFGAVHGSVGIFYQLFSGSAVIRINGDADARPDGRLHLTHINRLPNCFHEGFGYSLNILAALRIHQYV